jgi:hypothetical protein
VYFCISLCSYINPDQKKKNKKLQAELDKKKDTQELEQMITKLKVEIEEDKRIEEALKEQLEGKDRIIGNLEAEIVTLKKDIQKKNMQNSSKVLDDIINSQKSYLDKSRLGYNQTEKGSSSKTTKQETNPKSYVETIKGDKNIYKEDYRDTPPPRRFRFQNQQQIDRPQEEEGFIRAPPFIRSSTTRYRTIFFGLCYACNNFGHKAVNCRANNKNNNYFESHTQRGYSRRPSETQRRSYNRFESLSTEVECYKCNNFGHMAKNWKFVATAARTSSNIYVLSEIGNEKCCLGNEDESWLWHKRMGHMHFDNLVKVNKREAVREMPQITKPTNSLCKHCQQGKQTKTRFKSKEYSTTKPLEIVHTDLVGPTTTKGLKGERYFMLLVDDYTRMTAVFFLKNKSKAFENFKIYKEMVENEMDSRIKCLRSDNGGEFTSKEFMNYCNNHGIKRQSSVARTPQQNGVVERKNMTVQEMARTMIMDSKSIDIF